MIGSRLLSGAGYALKVPAIDLAEVGSGGGSIIWIDAGGALQIGPHSAGASPGPVCYDLGGSEPTLTDANVVLGYINPEHLVGGALKLNAAKARSVIAKAIAPPLGMTVEEAAWGAHLIAASNMIRAIKAVSSERGRDPRDYALVAFGGNGPLFAAVMAEALMIRRVVVPPSAGVFSSYGLLYSEVAYHFTRTKKALLGVIDPGEIRAILEELEREARARLAEDGFADDWVVLERVAALHYQGQSFELEVPVPAGVIGRAELAALDEAFGIEHERTYGHRAGAEEPVELVTLKVVGRGVPMCRAPHSRPGPRCRKAWSSPSRCDGPTSAQAMVGATLVSSTVPISPSRALDRVSSRDTLDLRRPARFGRDPRSLWQHRYRCVADRRPVTTTKRRKLRCAVRA